MADQTEVIRKQMEETRSHLADKLEALESQVTETVESTTEAVSETVEAVKETVENVTSSVQDTVQSVEETFNLRRQTERHPWIVFGGSVAVGTLLAQLLGRSSNRSAQAETWTERERSYPRPETRPSEERSGNRSADYSSPPAPPAEARAAGTRSWFWEEAGRLKGLAVGTLMGVVRDLAARSVSGELGQRLAQEVDKLTSSLGGEVIHGPLLPKDSTET